MRRLLLSMIVLLLFVMTVPVMAQYSYHRSPAGTEGDDSNYCGPWDGSDNDTADGRDFNDSSGVIYYHPTGDWIMIDQQAIGVWETCSNYPTYEVSYECYGAGANDNEGITTVSKTSDAILIMSEDGGICHVSASDIYSETSPEVAGWKWTTGAVSTDSDCGSTNPGTNNVEGITFVPDESCSDCRWGGYILISQQSGGPMWKYRVVDSTGALDCMTTWTKPTGGCNGGGVNGHFSALNYDYDNDIVYVMTNDGVCGLDPDNFQDDWTWSIAYTEPITHDNYEGFTFGGGKIAVTSDTDDQGGVQNGLWVFEDQYCGDDVISSVETCDGDALDGETCLSQTPSTPHGTLACAGTCDAFDTSACVECEDAADCDDSIACTTDTCNPSGTCVFTAVDGNCDDSKPCTDDTCSAATGCVFTDDDTNLCSDSNDCTSGDSCSDGACISGTAGACTAGGTVLYYRDHDGGANPFEPSANAVQYIGMDLSGDGIDTDTTNSSGGWGFGGLIGEVVIGGANYGNGEIANDNDAVTSYDASFVARHAAELIVLSANQQIAADVTGAGGISATDAAAIAQWAVGLLPGGHFPVADNTSDWAFRDCETYTGSEDNNCVDAPHTEDPIEANITVDFYAILYGDVTGNWEPAGKSMTIGGELSAEDKIAKADAARAVELAAIVKPSSPSYRSLDVAFEISHVSTTGISRDFWERVFLLKADDIDDVIGIDITLVFDADEVVITDIEKESLVSGFALVENGAIKDQYYIGLYTAIAATGDGDVLTITLVHETPFNPGAGVPFSVELAANEEDIDVD